jgi:hypothetical protein
MNNHASVAEDRKLRLKKTNGWFPAGESFLRAMTQLSDGAFKLFVFLCLNADRKNATLAASQIRLAEAIGKSKPAIERYTAELEIKGFCSVHSSRIPYVGTSFRISEEYWPYQSADSPTNEGAAKGYVQAVKKLFLGLECASGRFGPPEVRQAQALETQGVTLQELEDAMIVGACRKYVSWLNNGPSEPIGSLNYFATLIEEVRERPFPPGYRDYLRMEVRKLSRLWEQSTGQSAQTSAPEESHLTTQPNRRAARQNEDKERRDDVDPLEAIHLKIRNAERLETIMRKIDMESKNS